MLFDAGVCPSTALHCRNVVDGLDRIGTIGSYGAGLAR